MGIPLIEPWLVVHVFGYRSGAALEQSLEHLDTVWEACRSTLDLLPVGEEPADLRRAMSTVSGPIAMRRGSIEGEEAVLRADGQVVTLSVRLRGVDGADWCELERRWSAAGLVTPSALLGSVAVLLARVPGDAGIDELDPFPGTVGLADPRPGAAAVVGGRHHVWELGDADDDGRVTRRIAVVDTSGPAHEAAIWSWLWSDGDARAAAFVEYLLQTAQLRYEYRVWRADRSVYRSDADADAVDALMDILGSAERDHTALLDRDEVQVREAQARRARLVTVMTRLRFMQRFAAETHAHLVAAVPSADGLFADDAQLADWFAAQLGDDCAFVETVRDRAREIDTLAEAAVQRRLDERQERRERADAVATVERERVGLLQASALGAAGLALAALQALGYGFAIDPGFKLAIATVITSAALWLSVGAVAVARPGRPSVTGVLVAATGAVTGAAVWTAVEFTNVHRSPHLGTALPSWSAFVGGIVVASVVVAARGIRRRRSARPARAAGSGSGSDSA